MIKFLTIIGIAIAIALAGLIISVIAIALLNGLAFLFGSKIIAFLIVIVPCILFLACFWYNLIWNPGHD